jgi:CelD/BcsL family acetyltransferase involved in cellulose biosynthesis
MTSETFDARSAVPSSPMSYRVDFLSPEDIAGAPAIEAAWRRLASQNDHLTAMFQSPEHWAFHIARQPAHTYLLGVVYGEGEEVVGVLPAIVKPFPLAMDAAGRHLGTLRVNCLQVFGGPFLMPQEEDLYATVIRRIMDSRPDIDAVFLNYVRPDDPVWTFVTNAGGAIRREWIVHFPEGARELHTIALAGNFDEYLRKFSGKTRSTLKRKLRQMKERSNGALELVRVDRGEQVEDFLRRSEAVSRHSWQFRQFGTQIVTTPVEAAAFKLLAKQGMLRSYLLRTGNDDCAFCIGWQYNGVFHYVRPAFDDRFADLSPGTILLYLMIEDLCKHEPVKRFNFFQNPNPYKRQFGTDFGYDGAVLICRKTIPMRAKIAMHAGLRSIIRRAKDLLHKPRDKEWWEAALTVHTVDESK